MVRFDNASADWKSDKKMRRAIPNKSRGTSPLVITLTLIVCTIGLVAFLHQFNSSLKPRSAQSSEQETSDTRLESQVVEIARAFICPCGECGNLSVADCTCETARQVRQSIRASLMVGRDPTQIIADVEKTFGGRKL